MYYDLKKPLFVIVGSWNPAILSPPWLATHVFGFKEGDDIEGWLVNVRGPSEGRTIFFIDGVGIAASNSRVELFPREGDQIEATAAAAKKLVETLEHTPYTGLGINFLFQETEPEDKLIDMLKTRDSIHAKYEVKEQLFRSVVRVEDDVDLNLSVTNSIDSVAFDFNYHHTNFSLDKLLSLIEVKWSERKSHAESLLKELYELECDATLTFKDLQDQKKEGESDD